MTDKPSILIVDDTPEKVTIMERLLRDALPDPGGHQRRARR